MKKILLSLSALLMGVVLFTSCDDDTPQLRPVPTTEGAFVMCSGNMGKKMIVKILSRW